jgi:hypothetical protein
MRVCPTPVYVPSLYFCFGAGVGAVFVELDFEVLDELDVPVLDELDVVVLVDLLEPVFTFFPDDLVEVLWFWDDVLVTVLVCEAAALLDDD